MVREFILDIPGDPVPKARPRVYQGHAVTPQRTRDAEALIGTQFRSKYPNAVPMTGPVELNLAFYMSKRGRPDYDNLAKLVTDALNGLAYQDDQQVQWCLITKIVPDMLVPSHREGKLRQRRSGDPLTSYGREYQPHTRVRIIEHPDH